MGRSTDEIAQARRRKTALQAQVRELDEQLTRIDNELQTADAVLRAATLDRDEARETLKSRTASEQDKRAATKALSTAQPIIDAKGRAIAGLQAQKQTLTAQRTPAVSELETINRWLKY